MPRDEGRYIQRIKRRLSLPCEGSDCHFLSRLQGKEEKALQKLAKELIDWLEVPDAEFFEAVGD